MSQLICTQQEQQLDWRAIVQQERPGQGSPLQQARAQVLARIGPKLDMWAERRGFPAARVAASAYIGVIGVVQPQLFERALAFAKYTLWLFALDEFIDLLDYRELRDDQPAEKQAYLEGHLEPLTTLLWTLAELAPASIKLGQESQSIRGASRDLPPSYQQAAALAAGFQDIYLSLYPLYDDLASDDRRFCLRTFASETARVVAAMRAEAYQNYVYHATGAVPSLEAYFEHARFSICVRAAAAFALGFEAAPQAVWPAWLPGMSPGAKVVRLANDLANVEREAAERKINAVVITLSEAGVPALDARPQPAELAAARQRLTIALQDELRRFERLRQKLPDGPVAQNIVNGVAFSVAMYERGDYIPPP